jgi:ribose-phosphate pyrophosphokinase
MSEILIDTLDDLSKEVPFTIYPSGEPLIDYKKAVPASLGTIMLRPRSITSFMAGLWLVDSYIERGFKVGELVLPFVPGARQDRINNSGDFLFTAKSVAKEINLRNFRSVIVVDPHSDVISGLIDRCVVIKPENFLVPHTQNRYQAIIAPDSGAEKRARGVANKLNLPLIHAWKNRNISTGELSDFGHEPIPSGVKRCLIVDDICDGGGTFELLGTQLRDQGVSSDLYVTHGVFSKGLTKLLKIFDKIITTDSIVNTEALQDYGNDCPDLQQRRLLKRIAIERQERLIVLNVCHQLLRGVSPAVSIDINAQRALLWGKEGN